MRNEEEVEEDEDANGDFARGGSVGGADPFEVLEDGDKNQRADTGGEGAETANEEEKAGEAELDVFRAAGAGDFFDEVARPD